MLHGFPFSEAVVFLYKVELSIGYWKCLPNGEVIQFTSSISISTTEIFVFPNKKRLTHQENISIITDYDNYMLSKKATMMYFDAGVE